ncbi:MAG: hypothetical protein WBA76_06575, partial [Phormidesmis sp.]
AREDAITRPASTANWASCDTLTEVLTADCWMRATRSVADGGPTDPPLSRRSDSTSPALGSFVGISAKPVDFAPDPDRRPHGFRLNAALNNNSGNLSGINYARTAGLTFVTDNAAYIKGEFNPHSSNGTDSLEEFTQTLSNPSGGNVNFGNPFYNGRTTSNLTQFAVGTIDRWRVAEILADSVTLLSDDFVDGAVEEGFIRNRTEVSNVFKNSSGNDSRTSFHNQQRIVRDSGSLVGNANQWLRIDGRFGDASPTPGDTSIPIWISRNGWSKSSSGSAAGLLVHREATQVIGGWFELPDQRSVDALIDANVPERINATIISGLVPTRAGQGSGGLHNFPRFLEDWDKKDLFIQGAFLQLNFSTAGTAPFDADAWEPGETPVTPAISAANHQYINYYKEPARRWGYDVALQLAPAGPIAERFVTVGKPRSEHYRELPVEDPYVTNLRCSKVRQNPALPTSPLVRRFPKEVCP